MTFSPQKARKPMKRSGRIKPKKRTPSEFARIYGSKARVEWVKSLPCAGCGGGHSQNAHTATGGMGRKGDAETIVPLCGPHDGLPGCHSDYDQHRPPFNRAEFRAFVEAHAACATDAWLRSQEGA